MLPRPDSAGGAQSRNKTAARSGPAAPARSPSCPENSAPPLPQTTVKHNTARPHHPIRCRRKDRNNAGDQPRRWHPRLSQSQTYKVEPAANEIPRPAKTSWHKACVRVAHGRQRRVADRARYVLSAVANTTTTLALPGEGKPVQSSWERNRRGRKHSPTEVRHQSAVDPDIQEFK